MLNKLDKFRYSSMHKRRFYIVLGIVIGIFALAAGLLATLGIFGKASDCVRVRVLPDSEELYAGGCGINLTQMPSANRVENGDFELESNYSSYTVTGSDSNYVFFDVDTDFAADDVRTGSSLSVYSIDGLGTMSLKHSAHVVEVDNSRLGNATPVSDEWRYWSDGEIVKIISYDGIVDVLTSDGIIVADVTSESQLRLVEESRSFVDMSSCANGVYAITATGKLYYSQDGRQFALACDITLGEEQEIISLAGNRNCQLIGLSDGKFVTVVNGVVYANNNGFDATQSYIRDLNDKLLVIADRAVYISSNGLIFSHLTEFDRYLYRKEVKCVSASEDKLAILTEDGKLVTADFESDNPEIAEYDLSMAIPVVVEIDSSGTVVAIMQDGSVNLLGSRSGVFSNVYSGAPMTEILPLGKGHYVANCSNQLFVYSIVSGLRVDDVIEEESIYAGDICIVENAASSAMKSDWTAYGEGTEIHYDYSLENGGYMNVQGIGDGVHAASYRLKGNANENFAENSFYRIEANIRSVGEVNNIHIWVTGGEDSSFGEMGITVDDKSFIGAKTFSNVFAITDEMIDDEVIRLNISFEGTGSLCVDDVYLGEDKYDANSIPEYFNNAVTASMPDAIRFDNIEFCTSGFCSRRFYGLAVDSLERSLITARDSHAQPWYIIGASATQDEINNFMEYLAGSVSSTYGLKRTDNGTALPWSRQFGTFYIEIADEDGVFSSDVQRGAYVNYVMGMFRQSEYYSELKGKLFFLDSMHYDGGSVLSSADSHAMSMVLQGSVNDDTKSILDNTLTNASVNAPRISVGNSNGEFINSVSSDYGDLSPAQYTALFTNENSVFIRMMMMDLDLSDRPVDMTSENVFISKSGEQILTMISNLNSLRRGVHRQFELLDPISNDSVENALDFADSCSVSCIETSSTVNIVVVNLSDSMQQFVTEGITIISNGTVVKRFAADGTLLTDREISRFDQRFNMQAGETVVISIPKGN